MLTETVKITLGGPFRMASRILLILSTFCFSGVCMGQTTGTAAPVIHECWRYHSTNLTPTTAVSDGASVYVAERGGRVSAISAEDGKRLWSTELGGELLSNLAVADREIQVVTHSAVGANELRSLSVVSGILNRSVPLPTSGQVRINAIGDRIVIASSTGEVSGVDPAAGKVIWTKRLDSEPRVLAFNDAVVVVGLAGRRVAIIDSTDGKLMREFEVNFVPSSLLADHEHLFIGDERGNITALNLGKNRKVWSFKSGGKISGIYPVSDASLLITSFDNFTYLVDRDTGHVIWKIRQSSRVVDAAIVSSNYAGITPAGEPAVFLLDPNSGKSLGRVVLSEPSEFVQAAQLVGDSIITFTNDGLVSFGVYGCKKREKAEASASAFK